MRWYWGLAAVGAGVAIGASIGAATNRPCPPGGPTLDTLFCGPKGGAFVGALGGTLLAGVAGLIALVSKDTRAAGATAAAPAAILLAAAGTRAALR